MLYLLELSYKRVFSALLGLLIGCRSHWRLVIGDVSYRRVDSALLGVTYRLYGQLWAQTNVSYGLKLTITNYYKWDEIDTTSGITLTNNFVVHFTRLGFERLYIITPNISQNSNCGL